jgi:polysaccharide biosynthesis protein PslH
MRSLRIVLVMIEPPLPFGNAAARWYYVLLKGLVERGHRVIAFASCSQPADIDRTRALFPAPGYDLRLYSFPDRNGPLASFETLRRPFSYMFGPDLKRDLNGTLAEGFDILHLEQLWTGWIGLEHADRALVNVHYLLEIDQGEFRPRSFEDWKSKFLGLRAERRMARAFRFFRSCTPRLEVALRRMNPSADVTTVPFGLDSSLYKFISGDRRQSEPTLTLIGSMMWGPSRSAAVRLLTRLWPEIKRRVPETRLQIVGWNAREALAEFLAMPDVTVVENVPDARPYFEAASVLLYAPGRGSGMKIKIQEAMAYGVPVVTTTEGVEGLPVEDGVHAGVCDDDDGLIERTVALLRDLPRQDRQRVAARRLIETFCGPSPTLDAIEAIYGRMLAAPSGG